MNPPTPFDALELADLAIRSRRLAELSASAAEAACLVALAAHATELVGALTVEPRGEQAFGPSDVRGAYPAAAAREFLKQHAQPRARPAASHESLMGAASDADQSEGKFVAPGSGAPAYELPPDPMADEEPNLQEEEKVTWLARLVARRRGVKTAPVRGAIVAALDGRRLIDLIESGKLAEFLKLLLQLLPLFV